MLTDDYKFVQDYAEEDGDIIFDNISEAGIKTATRSDVKCTSNGSLIECSMDIKLDDKTVVPFTWKYEVSGEDVYSSLDASTWLNFVYNVKRAGAVEAAAKIRKHSTAIFAADDDYAAIDSFESPTEEFNDDEGGIADDVEEVQDQVEEIKDDIDNMDEDDIDIEIDNNIANHYIAECDNCHGVFISAMLETDQQVDHISGVCPLCQKDTDQKLKWIIRSVTDEDGGI